MIADYTARMGLVAQLRRLLHRLAGYNGELCQFCGRRYDRMVWRADDELWRAVIPYDVGLSCPSCFGRRARANGFCLRWQPSICHVRDPLANGGWIEPHPDALARHFGTFELQELLREEARLGKPPGP